MIERSVVDRSIVLNRRFPLSSPSFFFFYIYILFRRKSASIVPVVCIPRGRKRVILIARTEGKKELVWSCRDDEQF